MRERQLLWPCRQYLVERFGPSAHSGEPAARGHNLGQRTQPRRPGPAVRRIRAVRIWARRRPGRHRRVHRNQVRLDQLTRSGLARIAMPKLDLVTGQIQKSRTKGFDNRGNGVASHTGEIGGVSLADQHGLSSASRTPAARKLPRPNARLSRPAIHATLRGYWKEARRLVAAGSCPPTP